MTIILIACAVGICAVVCGFIWAAFRNPIVTHPDGKRFQRNANDQWMPI